MLWNHGYPVIHTWKILPPLFIALTPTTGLAFSTASKKIWSGSVWIELGSAASLCLKKNKPNSTNRIEYSGHSYTTLDRADWQIHSRCCWASNWIPEIRVTQNYLTRQLGHSIGNNLNQNNLSFCLEERTSLCRKIIYSKKIWTCQQKFENQRMSLPWKTSELHCIPGRNS